MQNEKNNTYRKNDGAVDDRGCVRRVFDSNYSNRLRNKKEKYCEDWYLQNGTNFQVV